ncbi:MAG: cytochrome c biogenesis protein CcsA [Opitutae bacterium]|nr:cytochrome c biogenesis protein CcsA [Opitutae bacterium]
MKRFLPLLVLVLGVVYLGSTLRPQRDRTAFKLNDLDRVPVLVNGRIKPLDTVARTSLLTLQGRQRLVTPDGRSLPPAEWLADVLFAPAKADTYRCLLIENHEVLDLLGLKPADGDGGKRFSYAQLREKLPELEKQARLADGVEQPLRTPFQKQVVTVRDRVILYLQLKTSVQMPDSTDFLTELQQFEKALPAGIAAVLAKQQGREHSADAVKAMREMADRFSYMEQLGYLRLVPPAAGDADPTNWRPVGSTLLDSFGSARVSPIVMEYARLGYAWRNGDAAGFNRITLSLHDELAKHFAPQMQKSDIEARFNAAQPFYSSMSLYVLAFLLAVFSWLKWPQELGRAAFWLLALAWAATTVGIATRMWLEARPPVTNLYSSALFIGWASVGLCLVLEKIFRNGVGSVAGGAVGFATLLIAHHLSLSGDTLEMMRAVLDSNFWLATHVVTVTIGYSATYLAGFLAIIYIFRGVFTRTLDQPTADALTRMVYGIVCFATLFSLVGTVLGGIWADQSWGRFWGWDPKENGALIIVIWNAVILHARWGGIVRARGLMTMAVFGNIVTSWSWFGTNMLGVGLHSYGFMESAFYALIGFVASQLLIMVIALVPLEKWRSHRDTPAAA